MKKISGLLVAFILMFFTLTAYAATPADHDGVISHNGVKMFPVRTVATLLKTNLQWNQHDKSAVMIIEGKTVKFRAGEKWVSVDNQNYTMDHPVYIKNGRIYISEASLKDIWNIEIEYVDGRANLKIVVEKNIVDTAVAAGDFGTLVTAVKAAGLVDTLKGKGPFTVFAPTDKAFEKLPKGTVENLLKPENKDTLIDILTYHVVADDLMASDVVEMERIKMLNGDFADIEIKGGKAMIDGATITMTDIVASNGVIHVIDAVMLP